jgi:redox-sensing transcriptional repressor
VKRIAESSVRRLSLYLRYLEDFRARGQSTVSSSELAGASGTTPAQVRKDLSFFGSFGKRGLGYPVDALAERIRKILGIGRTWRVVIVGVGKMGAALAQYREFRSLGFELVGLFDVDPARIGRRLEGLAIRGMARFDTDLRRLKPHIAIVTVPGDAAQDVVDHLARAGVRAVLNFAPTGVHVPGGVVVRTVNMALELEVLSYSLVAAERP